jgi:hypothetical protein
MEIQFIPHREHYALQLEKAGWREQHSEIREGGYCKNHMEHCVGITQRSRTLELVVCTVTIRSKGRSKMPICDQSKHITKTCNEEIRESIHIFHY